MNKRIDKDIKVQNLIKEFPTALIRWYPFRTGSSICYVGDRDAIYDMLADGYGTMQNVTYTAKADSVDAMSDTGKVDIVDTGSEPTGVYDYIVCIGYAEQIRDIAGVLKGFRSHLSDGGCLLLGMHNRLGLRYFCGDKDPYTDRIFDGLEDYVRVYGKDEDEFYGRTYDRMQLEGLLKGAGFTYHKFYSVFSGLEHAPFIFADGYIPNEDLANRHFPVYHYPDSLFLEEEKLYHTLMENGMFHKMANAYLIECPLDGIYSDALQITTSLDRGRDNAVITIIHSDNTVTKQAAYPEGQAHIEDIFKHNEMLRKRGIPVVDARMENGIYVMPYIKADTGQIYLEKLLRKDRKAFLEKMDMFREMILKSSDIHKGCYKEEKPVFDSYNEDKVWRERNEREWGHDEVDLLRDGFIDLVPLNSLYVDDRFVFIDQEFCVKDLPADVPVSRMVFTFFCGDPGIRKLMYPKELYDRYDIPDPSHTEGGSRYLNMEFRYFDRIMHRDVLREYYMKSRKDPGIINSNRQRMNYSAITYKRLFEDTFEGVYGKKLILFGSGCFAQQFLSRYGHLFNIEAAVDNNVNRQGKRMYRDGYAPVDETGSLKGCDPEEEEKTGKETDCNRIKGKTAVSTDKKYTGIMIHAPEFLNTLKHGEYKVIVCIKNFTSVMNQLDDMGIYEYAVYDPGRDYRLDRRMRLSASGRDEIPVPAGDEAYAKETGDDKDDNKIEARRKYHIGYTPGAYDMFHIGHVNLLKRSKEMCDYLIAGVMSDEAIRDFKKKEPVIPYEQRAAVVASCRYVDEVVEIPYKSGQADEAWKLYHFDVLFCGSDYEGNEGRAKEKEFLESHGATIEIFPYTEGTSSSMIRDALKGKDR